MWRKIALFIAVTTVSVHVLASDSLKPNPEAERWIAGRLARGLAADLKDAFPQEDRRVGGSFLSDLLTATPAAVCDREGILICNATVIGRLNLLNADIQVRALFVHCSFQDTVTFQEADVWEKLSFASCSFDDHVSFQEMRSRNGLWLNQCHFLGTATFLRARLEASLELCGAVFDSSSDTTSFNAICLGGSLAVIGATFYRPVDFTGAEIGELLWADNARFMSKALVSMFAVRAKRCVSFENAVFMGPIDLSNSITEVILGRGATFASTEVNQFSFAQCGGCNLSWARFDGPVLFEGFVASQLLAFIGTSFADVHLTNMTVGTDLRLDGTSFKGLLSLTGTHYSRISRGPETAESRDSCFRELLVLVNNSFFSADIYTTLEEQFRRRGYNEWADRTYIEMKRREISHLDLLSASWSWLLDVTMLYGCSVRRLLAWMFVLVAFGRCWFYRAIWMCAKGDKQPVPRYRAWWYSLDLFIPLIRLGMADCYQPRPDRTATWFYLRIHRLLGWVFAALLVTAITGIMR